MCTIFPGQAPHPHQGLLGLLLGTTILRVLPRRRRNIIMRRRWLDDLFHYFAVDQQRLPLDGRLILMEDRDRWWRQRRSNSIIMRPPWIHFHYDVRR